MKKQKAMKWVSNIFSGVLILLLISVASIVFMTKASGGEPQIAGYQLKSVLSGSMEPGIQTGSIIAVKAVEDKTKLNTGDVITFQTEEDILVTHRITEVMTNGDSVLYRTKGDNNNTEDTNPVLSENVTAVYQGFTVPYAGYFINFAQSKNGAFLLLVPGFLLLFYSGYTIWRTLAQVDISTKKVQTEE